jgi:integrase
VERRIDRGETPSPRVRVAPTTFGHLVELHIQDMLEVGKARRSNAASLDALKAKLGRVALRDITRERLIQFGRDRAKEGAGPVTVGMDLGYVKTVLTHAAAVHGVAISPEPVDLARAALKRLGLVGCGRERDRRPTQSELDRLYAYFDANPRQIIPLSRIVRFAIATAMRQDEICRIAWKDVDEEHRTVLVRNRKDPRDEAGNDQKLPLLDATGLDAWALLAEQRRFSRGPGRVFPHKGRSVGTAFRRACLELKIDDLHFHDLLPGASSARGLAAWGSGGFRPTGRSGTRAGRVEGPAPA